MSENLRLLRLQQQSLEEIPADYAYKLHQPCRIDLVSELSNILLKLRYKKYSKLFEIYSSGYEAGSCIFDKTYSQSAVNKVTFTISSMVTSASNSIRIQLRNSVAASDSDP